MSTIIPSKTQAIQKALIGDWKNATLINKAILKENPNDIDALNRLAFASTILGKIKEAKSAYRKVLKLDSVNPIALRNIKRLSGYSLGKTNKGGIVSQVASFLEEDGKTKVVELINVAQARVIARLRTGQPLTMSIKRLKVFILENGKQYIGMLPDDISKRLIGFIKGGGIYETYVKLVNERRVVVFIKEVEKSSRFKDQPSFLQTSEKLLSLEKGGTKIKNYYKDKEREENNYLEETEGES